jgi:hypothetical protein
MYFLTILLGIYTVCPFISWKRGSFYPGKTQGKLIPFLLEVRTRIISWETFSSLFYFYSAVSCFLVFCFTRVEAYMYVGKDVLLTLMGQSSHNGHWYTVKKVSDFPVPSQDVTYQTIPEPVFVDLLGSPGIDSQPGVSVR